jgi:hypothetical protein
MTRLRHSAGGYRRRLQIGAANVVLIAEGKTDRYFYSKLFNPFCSRIGAHCAIRIARELPTAAGGKTSLLAYFEYLRRRKSLSSELGGKRTVIVFLLDKDIDDRQRKKRRSNHIFYTEGYDFENYLYKHGDLVEAGAAAAGLDVMSVAASIPDQQAWRQQVTQEWKEWVKICVFSITRKVRKGGNYGVPASPINKAHHGGVDSTAYEARLRLLESSCSLGSQGFKRAWNSVSRMVDGLYASASQDEIFKGKWYSWFLAQDLRKIAAGRDAELDGLEKRLPHHLAQTINYEEQWTNPHRERLRALIQACGI